MKTTIKEVFERVASEARSNFKIEVKVDKSGCPYFESYFPDTKSTVSTWAMWYEFGDLSNKDNLKKCIREVKDSLGWHEILSEETINEDFPEEVYDRFCQ